MTDKENEIPTIKLDSVETKKGNKPSYNISEQKALHDILHKTYPIIDSDNIKGSSAFLMGKFMQSLRNL